MRRQAGTHQSQRSLAMQCEWHVQDSVVAPGQRRERLDSEGLSGSRSLWAGPVDAGAAYLCTEEGS